MISTADLKQALADALDREEHGGPRARVEAHAQIRNLSQELAHQLKTWPPYHRPLLEGETHDVRRQTYGDVRRVWRGLGSGAVRHGLFQQPGHHLQG